MRPAGLVSRASRPRQAAAAASSGRRAARRPGRGARRSWHGRSGAHRWLPRRECAKCARSRRVGQPVERRAGHAEVRRAQGSQGRRAVPDPVPGPARRRGRPCGIWPPRSMPSRWWVPRSACSAASAFAAASLARPAVPARGPDRASLAMVAGHRCPARGRPRRHRRRRWAPAPIASGRWRSWRDSRIGSFGALALMISLLARLMALAPMWDPRQVDGGPGRRRHGLARASCRWSCCCSPAPGRPASPPRPGRPEPVRVMIGSFIAIGAAVLLLPLADGRCRPCSPSTGRVAAAGRLARPPLRRLHRRHAGRRAADGRDRLPVRHRVAPADAA